MTIRVDPYEGLAGALFMDPWAADAACIGKWAVLESPHEDAGLALCDACPVKTECREWTIGLPGRADPGGIRGGTTSRQRWRERQRLGIAKKREENAA